MLLDFNYSLFVLNLIENTRNVRSSEVNSDLVVVLGLLSAMLKTGSRQTASASCLCAFTSPINP